MRFTQAQSQAIYADNRELLVSAAAGSGKTAVLVERIVDMIANKGMSIDRMLIVTFTRAAAAEMRERIELRLSEKDDPNLQKQAELVANAQISTIHSFCQKVIKRYFQALEVDPQFTLLDEREQTMLYEQAMETALDTIYSRAKEKERLAVVVAKYTEREIATMLRILHSFLLSRPNFVGWLAQHSLKEWSIETLDSEPAAKAFVSEALPVISGMLAIWEKTWALKDNPAFPPPYQKTMKADFETIVEFKEACEGGFCALARYLSTMRFQVLARYTPNTGDEVIMAETYKALRKRYKDMLDEFKKLMPISPEQGVSDMEYMYTATRGMADAVSILWEEYVTLKQERNVLDFNDLEQHTLMLLEQEAIQKEISSQYDAVFVDEYQDISALQESILQQLKRPVDAQNKQYFFYVGDVKQSIYRFRLALPELFLFKLHKFSADEVADQRKIILNKNFRSRCSVLHAVNRVFSHVMNASVTEIDYNEEAMLYPGTESKKDPLTELHILNSAGSKSADMVLAEAELIAKDICQTVGTPVYDGEGKECGVLKYSDIAILMPVSRNVADKVELVLTRAGIPVYCENSGDSLSSDEVTQVVQHLILMDNLQNDIALISELRSPLFEMTESDLARIRLSKPEKEAGFLSAMQYTATLETPLAKRCSDALSMLETERFLYNHMPLEEYLWDFITRTGLYAHYGAQPGGKQRQANLRLMCQQAGEYMQTHADGITGYLQTVSMGAAAGQSGSPTIINPWENVVRVMTIHKSKGLEFPTVYVMGLGGSLRRRTATHAISTHGILGYGLGYVNEVTRTRRSTLLQGAIDLKERKEDKAERARVLYVAMTRPKNRLVLVGSCSEGTLDYETMLESCRNGTAGQADIYEVRSAHSMLEWVAQCIRPGDILEKWARESFPTERMREKKKTRELPTNSTSFPQKEGVWRVVFHTEPDFSTRSQSGTEIDRLIPFETAAQTPKTAGEADVLTDPILPTLPQSGRPLKLGVSALCRMMDEADSRFQTAPTDEEGETAEQKRYPMTGNHGKALDSLPELPAFMAPKAEQTAVERGVQTHKLLGLLSLEGAKQAMGDEVAMSAYLQKEVERLVQQGIVTKEQSAAMDLPMALRFLTSELGTRMLRAKTVHREWSFNLRITEPFETQLQGVIDLCFLENDSWVLVDFKTDKVKSTDELWQRYGRQMHFYHEALLRITPYPVAECSLFSLRLGQNGDAPPSFFKM